MLRIAAAPLTVPHRPARVFRSPRGLLPPPQVPARAMPKKKADSESEFEESDEEFLDLPKKKTKAKAKAKAPPKKKAKKEDSDDEEKPKKKAAPRAKKADIVEGAKIKSNFTMHPPSLLSYSHPPGKELPNSEKCAMYDLDGTLVVLKTGTPQRGPTSNTDFGIFNDKTTPARLKELHSQGFKIVILSNQGGVKSALNGAMAEKVTSRVVNAMAKISQKAELDEPLPYQVVMATMDDDNRKPKTGMFEFFVEHLNGGVRPSAESFFCGDAAGRDGDFAQSDKDFAEKIGYEFRTPEDEFGSCSHKQSAVVVGGEMPNKSPELCAALTEFAQLCQDASKHIPAPGVDPDIPFGEEGKTAKGLSFKAGALRRAVAEIECLPEPITKDWNKKRLKEIKGVGDGTATAILEWFASGEFTKAAKYKWYLEIAGGKDPEVQKKTKKAEKRAEQENAVAHNLL
ncbi:unnamed protein product [Pedinophyceae sp. YPF-701]|nr:unnamed protein product [Pedinophyceae sp. YPF-701]